MGVQVALVLVLILINAALSGSEMALVSLREGQLRRLARSGRAGARLSRLTRQLHDALGELRRFGNEASERRARQFRLELEELGRSLRLGLCLLGVRSMLDAVAASSDHVLA